MSTATAAHERFNDWIGRPIRILLVEDSPSDVVMTRTALREGHIANELAVVGDGEGNDGIVGAAEAADLDSRAVAVVIDGGRGGDGVVEQVDQRALQGFAIDRDQRD